MAVIIIQDDKIIYANHAYAALNRGTHWKKSFSGLQRIRFKLIHPDYRDFCFKPEPEKKRSTKKKRCHQKLPVQRCSWENGDIRWVDQYSQSVLYNGKPANMISMIDIHDRKLAEERLKESEERYRAIFDRSADCVFYQ